MDGIDFDALAGNKNTGWDKFRRGVSGATGAVSRRGSVVGLLGALLGAGRTPQDVAQEGYQADQMKNASEEARLNLGREKLTAQYAPGQMADAATAGKIALGKQQLGLQGEVEPGTSPQTFQQQFGIPAITTPEPLGEFKAPAPTMDESGRLAGGLRSDFQPSGLMADILARPTPTVEQEAKIDKMYSDSQARKTFADASLARATRPAAVHPPAEETATVQGQKVRASSIVDATRIRVLASELDKRRKNQQLEIAAGKGTNPANDKRIGELEKLIQGDGKPAATAAPAAVTTNFNSLQEAEAANLPVGTEVTVDGKRYRVE